MLDTTLEAGLSGTGRLHDLFLRWEAMSPGDYARGGAGLTIFWGWFESPFGPALVMGTEKGICGIGFAAETGARGGDGGPVARWPQRRLRRGSDACCAPWVARGLRRAARRDPAPLYLIGAPFQIKVWEALLRIPSRPCDDLFRHSPAPSATRPRSAPWARRWGATRSAS